MSGVRDRFKLYVSHDFSVISGYEQSIVIDEMTVKGHH